MTSHSVEELPARVRLALSLAPDEFDYSLSVGSANTEIGNVNIDIQRDEKLSIIGDARFLPIRDEVFDLVFFTDVIEHVPEGYELRSLQEICRVLKKEGKIILSTPNDTGFFRSLDPGVYLGRHRHYRFADLRDMLDKANFAAELAFTSAGFSVAFGVLIQDLILFPLKKITRYRLPLPRAIERSLAKDYARIYRDNRGYEIFVRAQKT